MPIGLTKSQNDGFAGSRHALAQASVGTCPTALTMPWYLVLQLWQPSSIV